MENQEPLHDRTPIHLENIISSVHQISTYSQSVLSLQSSFVGREYELGTIEQHFKDPNCRLLTLTGLGGIGKTRLALEVAQRLQATYSHGVHPVFLQSLASSELITATIARAVGFQFNPAGEPKQQLLDYFHDKSMILVIDNLEHLLEGAELLSEILNAAPNIRILATSRERLNLLEEWVLEVGGLSYPLSEMETEIESYSALTLFLQHARRVEVGFTLTSPQRPAAIRICRLVGGMPLGIELAAAWVQALPCRDIANEIERGLDILERPTRNIEPRHRAMRAAFEPTWARLSDNERKVFMRLSVFRGGFTREAAETVAGASLHILSALLSKSCLRHDPNGRYDLHELLRQYAEEKLNAAGDMAEAHNAHSDYYAAFMNCRIDDLKGRRQIEALAEITGDFENVRTAWIWAAEHKHVQNIEYMLESLWLFCDTRSRYHESSLLFRSAEQAFSGENRFERLWSRLLARSNGKLERLQPQLEDALRLARHYEDLGEIAFCLQQLGQFAYDTEDYAKAKQLRQQSLAAYRHVGDRYYMASVLWDLMDGQRASVHEDAWDEFKHFGEESLRLRREIDDRVGIGWSIPPMAHGAARVGQFAQAEHLWLERIALGTEAGAPQLVARGYTHLSYQVYFIQGEFAKTRAAIEEAFKIEATIGLPNPGLGLTTLGLLASMEEQYEEGKILCQQAANSTTVIWVIDFATWGSAIAACGLGDYQAANTFFSAALNCRIRVYGMVGAISCLPIAAILLANNDNMVRAVELLALAFTHPVGAAGWMVKWHLLTRLCAQLEQALGNEVYVAAWERGTRLDLDEVATELLQQFQRTPILAKGEKISSPNLTLSERECEVLRLVAEGCSNQDIADRLFIGVSTVKKHINHIYDKLDAKNRTQAVAFARERQILINKPVFTP